MTKYIETINKLNDLLQNTTILETNQASSAEKIIKNINMTLDELNRLVIGTNIAYKKLYESKKSIDQCLN